METHNKLYEILRGHGKSITRPRALVFEVLRNNDPLSLGEIVKICAPHADRATVYRVMELFSKIKIVKRIPQGWHSRYELSEVFLPHHHHLVCSNCGRITIIKDRRLEQLLTDITAAHSFEPQTHTIELAGLCQRCLRTQASNHR